MADVKQQFLAVLEGVGRCKANNSGFSNGGTLKSTLPGLAVEGVGPVGLPLVDSQAEAIKGLCRAALQEQQAEVENSDTWQLGAALVSCRNPEWEALVGDVVRDSCEALGLNKAVAVVPVLRRLVLSGAGAGRRKVQQAKRAGAGEGAFAVLQVFLPCSYQGGALSVRLNKKSQWFDLAGSNAFQPCYVAYFAECEVSAEPLRSGHRLSLQYDLVFRGPGTPPSAAAPTGGAAELLRQAARAWGSQQGAPERLCYLLEGRYPKGRPLALRSLQGHDRAAADLLLAAAEGEGAEGGLLDVHLASMTKHESGYELGAEEKWGSEVDLAQVEVNWTVYRLTDWVALAGECFKEEELLVNAEQEILQGPQFFERLDNDIDREMELNDNFEDGGLDLYYRCAALVVWLRGNPWPLKCRTDIEGSVRWLAQSLGQGERGKEVRQCAQAVISYMATTDLPQESRWSWERAGEEPKASSPLKCVLAMLGHLRTLGDAELAGRFVAQAMPGKLQREMHAPLMALCQHFGWRAMQGPMAALAAAAAAQECRQGLAHLADLLYETAKAASGEAEAAPVLLQLAHTTVAALEGEKPGVYHALPDFVARLMAGLHLVPGAGALLAKAVRHLLHKPEWYTLDKSLLPACERVIGLLGPGAAAGCEPFCELVRHVLAELERRSAVKPDAPTSWAMSIDLNCSCPDCEQVQAFLRDPSKQRELFRWAKQRRSHVWGKLCRSYDVRCEEDNVSKPASGPRTYALVVTKTRASYEWAAKSYKEDRRSIDKLRGMLTAGDEEVRRSTRRRLQ